MNRLHKPLYHGTSNAASIMIVGGFGLKAPVYLTSDKCRAEHYAKAATAYLEKHAGDNGNKLIAEGYAIFTFHSIPNENELIIDDYNLEAEQGQWKYLKDIRGLQHFTIERYPLEADEAEHLRLQCFAIGMWSR